jgi:hypothetical protein
VNALAIDIYGLNFGRLGDHWRMENNPDWVSAEIFRFL